MSIELKDDKGEVIAIVTAAHTHSQGCDRGIWLEVKTEDKTRPTLCLVKDKEDGPFKGGWYLGVYRDACDPKLVACDLAVTFDKNDGPLLQVVRGKEIKSVNLFDLVSLLPAKE